MATHRKSKNSDLRKDFDVALKLLEKLRKKTNKGLSDKDKVRVESDFAQVSSLLQKLEPCVLLQGGESDGDLRETLMAKTLETLPVMVFAKNITDDYRFSIWNHAAERLVGLPAEMCLGKNDFDFFPEDQANFFRKKDEETASQEGVTVIPEEELDTPSGKRFLRTRKTVVRDEENRPIFLLGVSEDITEEKLAKQDLEIARNQLHRIISLVPSGIFEADELGRCIFVNDSFCKYSGISEEGVYNHGWFRGIHPQERALVEVAWVNSIETRKPFDQVFRFQHIDGHIVHVHARAEAVFDVHQNLTGFLGALQDVTEQHVVREKLLQTETELELFFDLSLELLFIMDSDQRFKKINPAVTKILGYSEEDLIGKSLLDLCHPEDVADVKFQLQKLARETEYFQVECRYRCKSGAYLILSISGSLDPDSGAIYVAARNVTESRAHERDLSSILQAISNSAIFGITDRSGIIVDVNENFEKISGYSQAELIGRTHNILNSGVHNKAFFKTLWRTIATGSVWSGEIVNRNKNGELYTVHTVISPLFGTDGKIDRFVSIRFDISQLKESERLLEEAQRVAKIGSWYYDDRTDTLHWSKQMFLLFDLNDAVEPQTLDSFIELIHLEDRERFAAQIATCLKDGTSFKERVKVDESEGEDGRHRWMEIAGEGVKEETASASIIRLRGTCQDISELVEAEEIAQRERAKSMQNAKLASLGEMSAGIAHEINNPLTIIVGSLWVLPKLINHPDKLLTKLEGVEKAAQRIAKIVSGLRKFSRSSEKKEYRFHKMTAIASESLILTASKANRNGVEILFQGSSDVQVLCDEIEIEQVLVNLINNSIDAVKSLDDRWVNVSVEDIGNEVVLRVMDSGKGISEDLQRKLFQPFFTTKPVGEGTGLGLSIAKGILEEHQATLELLVDEVNTCFEIRFPMAKEKEDVA